MSVKWEKLDDPEAVPGMQPVKETMPCDQRLEARVLTMVTLESIEIPPFQNNPRRQEVYLREFNEQPTKLETWFLVELLFDYSDCSFFVTRDGTTLWPVGLDDPEDEKDLLEMADVPQNIIDRLPVMKWQAAYGRRDTCFSLMHGPIHALRGCSRAVIDAIRKYIEETNGE